MAGHHIEAMLAGYGSGAAWASNERGERILNIDIGGGTTKFAIAEHGRVTATAATMSAGASMSSMAHARSSGSSRRAGGWPRGPE